MVGVEPFLRLPQQREREKAKTDGVKRHPFDGEGATHLHEVLQVGIGILMGLLTKWVGLHHIDKRRLEIKGGVSQVELGSHGYVSNRWGQEVGNHPLSHSFLKWWCGASFLE